jgi:hypothetical protein
MLHSIGYNQLPTYGTYQKSEGTVAEAWNLAVPQLDDSLSQTNAGECFSNSGKGETTSQQYKSVSLLAFTHYINEHSCINYR